MRKARTGTREIVQRLSKLNSRILLRDNLELIQAIGINDAVRAYGAAAKFQIRVDAHASYRRTIASNC